MFGVREVVPETSCSLFRRVNVIKSLIEKKKLDFNIAISVKRGSSFELSGSSSSMYMCKYV